MSGTTYVSLIVIANPVNWEDRKGSRKKRGYSVLV